MKEENGCDKGEREDKNNERITVGMESQNAGINAYDCGLTLVAQVSRRCTTSASYLMTRQHPLHG